MLATAHACIVCHSDFGPTADPVRLLDLTFHEVCAPYCDACGQRLGGSGGSQWRYSTRAVDGRGGYLVEPTAFWCPGCWRQSAAA